MLKEGQVRIPSGCAIAGIFSKDGKNFTGDVIVDAMTVMHDRSNGLGGGFAGYGIYNQYKELYALHVFYDNTSAKEECEKYLDSKFEIVNLSKIPTRKVDSIKDVPLIWRYFVAPDHNKLADSQLDEKEYVARAVIRINSTIEGAYVFSSGKNMGVFKAVGYPEDVGRFFCLDEYEGYSWTAHGRYPTNTPGWWGGSHPFALLEYSVVHNGEISSYDANRRFIEMFGYRCTLQTDTEVITYIIDYLVRKRGLKLDEVSSIIAAPFWSTIAKKPEDEEKLFLYFRCMFPSLLITGPFSIIVGFDGGMMALNDRLKLRSMVVAEKDNTFYVASEECAIRKMAPDIDNIWSPAGGQPIIVRLNCEDK